MRLLDYPFMGRQEGLQGLFSALLSVKAGDVGEGIVSIARASALAFWGPSRTQYSGSLISGSLIQHISVPIHVESERVDDLALRCVFLRCEDEDIR